MSIVRVLKRIPGRGEHVSGICAHCGERVFEAMCILDDCYNVWLGKCPKCEALNCLSMSHGLRGYSSQGMHLVLPTDEEVAANGWPEDTPTSGACGKPADQHGTPLGELCHRLRPTGGE